MKPAYRWSVSIALLVLTGLFVRKGMELWALGSEVDGAGIGVYFLSFEINDRVAEESIPAYAIRFFIAGGVTALAALAIALIKFNPGDSKQNYKKI